MDKTVIYLVKGAHQWEGSWIESAWSKEEDARHEKLVLEENSEGGDFYYVEELEVSG